MKLMEAVKKQRLLEGQADYSIADLTDNIEVFDALTSSVPVHIYLCNPCIISFSVTQNLEDHSEICCPNCQSEEVEDIGSGEMVVHHR